MVGSETIFREVYNEITMNSIFRSKKRNSNIAKSR